MSYPKPIVVAPPDGDVKATCIFLHGLGDSGNGWADVASMMPFPGVKWVFPTANSQPVTLNMVGAAVVMQARPPALKFPPSYNKRSHNLSATRNRLRQKFTQPDAKRNFCSFSLKT